MQPVTSETQDTVVNALLDQQSLLASDLEHAVDVGDTLEIEFYAPKLTAIEKALDELHPEWRTR